MANTINLLAPSTVIRKRNASDAYGKLLAAGCILAVLFTSAIAAGFYVLNWQSGKVLDRLNAEVKALDPVARRATAIEASRVRFGQTVRDVSRLKAQRPVFTAYLDELLNITPVDVNLSNIELKSNPFEATVKGVVYSQATVAQYGRNLQRSALFKDSIISSSAKDTGNDSAGSKAVDNTVSGDRPINFVISVTPEKKGDKQ